MKPRHALTRRAAWVLAALAILPLMVIAVRILALPGAMGPGAEAWRGIGGALDHVLSLSDVPVDQRDHVLYLLFLPTCALIVALARLTLGLRVLGFRSILIAVAFHQSGILPSLLLIAIAVLTVLLLRPWLKRMRMPIYARLSMILCTVSVTMVGAVLLGPWMRPDLSWGMAYFPVIVLGMVAEGIARTVDRGNAGEAWRLGITTILLAFVMVLVCGIPALREFILRFPEIVLTQIVAIALVSEYLDLRLLHRRRRRPARIAPLQRTDGPAVAVVRNRIASGAGHRNGLRSVQKIVDALRASGYRVRVLEGNASLPARLRAFFRPDPRTGERRGMVLNLAHGLQGDASPTHVPAVLEMSGIAYSGPTPLGHAMLFDRVLGKVVMRQAGIPTPAFRLIVDPGGDLGGLALPAVVRPRHDPDARPVVVTDRRELRTAVRRVVRRSRREAFIEELVTGRQISVGLLGNDPIECLPLVEIDRERNTRICPAPVDEVLAGRLRSLAEAAFRACGCRDYARVDLRVDERQEVWVLEVRTLGILAAGGTFALAAGQAGYRFQELLCHIVEVARIRARHAGRRARRHGAKTSPPPAEESVDAFEVAAAPGSG
ncbi:MAG TPA: 7TM domain-containing protein [Candidatus Eisenbacteria bacterium]|nr:7TM domain-containing protein [Candidatus Eisenbacteria bacterium]